MTDEGCLGNVWSKFVQLQVVCEPKMKPTLSVLTFLLFPTHRRKAEMELKRKQEEEERKRREKEEKMLQV